jgi:hypothetical protein
LALGAALVGPVFCALTRAVVAQICLN